MATRFELLQSELTAAPRTWLVTGAAGFIGSHLVEKLLKLEQRVIGLDNFSTGDRRNLDAVRETVVAEAWSQFRFEERDITRLEECRRAVAGVDYVLHQAALGSVPRSIEDPLRSHASNVDGFLNILVAARDARVQRFVYASSSSVYGDHPALPKKEDSVGRPLSPYAATKLFNEVYAGVFARGYGMPVIGLRYFNVFGPRQDPNGAYAAVVPRWFAALARGEPVKINGDGLTTRDFCYVANAVQANLLAATTVSRGAVGCVYNVACGVRTSLLDLHERIRALVAARLPEVAQLAPVFGPERAGDVRHSLADISLARDLLGYEPTHSLEKGLREAAGWYLRDEQVTTDAQRASRNSSAFTP
ncbi:MAG: SDR family oxidoreductase [Verrucomicrobia bacterium]|nr:SDR family oxidoreductase [Verrucomicrobiota bacterium]